MTKAEIIAELRRSATEDVYPGGEISYRAFDESRGWRRSAEWMCDLTNNDCRTFFLLVAEALETEKEAGNG